MADNDVLARLRESGVPEDLLREVNDGFMRNAHYTQSMQQLAQQREQVAYTLGQQSAGGPTKSVSKLEEYFSTLPDTEAAQGAKELFLGAFGAYREDLLREQQEQLKPLLSHVGKSARSEALEERLRSELLPVYGPELQTHWPKLRESMLAALDRNEAVDPIGFVMRAMPDKAQEMMIATRTEHQQKQAAQTGEGFATIARTAPPGGLAAPGGARLAEGGAAERRAPVPTMALLGEEFKAIAAQVAAGQTSR